MAKEKKKKKKFQSRSQEVLKTVYDKREEKSRSTGKSVWRADCPLPEFIPKKNNDYELADNIRNELKEKGIILKDTKDGVRWEKAD